MNAARCAPLCDAKPPGLLKLAITRARGSSVVMCVDCGANVDATDAPTLAAIRRTHRCRVLMPGGRGISCEGWPRPSGTRASPRLGKQKQRLPAYEVGT